MSGCTGDRAPRLVAPLPVRGSFPGRTRRARRGPTSKSRGTSRQEIPARPHRSRIRSPSSNRRMLEKNSISPPIVTRYEVGRAEVVGRGDAERKISKFLCDRLGALGEGGRIRRVPGLPGMLAHVRGDPSEPSLIAKLLGQAFGVAEMPEAGLEVTERPERVSEGEANVDGLLQRRRRLGKMAQGHQRLLEVGCRLAVGRPCEGFGPGLSQVRHRLLPHLAPEGVVGELFDVLGQALGMERLESLDDARVERAPAVLEEAPVAPRRASGRAGRCTRGRGRASPRRGTRRPEAASNPGASGPHSSSATASRSVNGTSLPMTDAVWSSRLFSGASRSMRAARIAWAVAGICRLCTGLVEPIRPALAREDLRLDQGPDALFEEERIPFRSLDQEPLEGMQTGVRSEERLEQLLGTLGR